MNEVKMVHYLYRGELGTPYLVIGNWYLGLG